MVILEFLSTIRKENKGSNTVMVATDVTISGGADDVWVFQISENLTMSSAVNITLSGGAQAKNIFWQVAGEVTSGTISLLRESSFR